MQALTLDAAGTLFDLAEPVGIVYARLAGQAGYQLDGDKLEESFRHHFSRLSSPKYSETTPGHETEKNWWRELVLITTALPDDAQFERFFASAFAYYERPEAWQLFPDTLPFLEKAAQEFRLAVVSNFDARLHPIIAGLGLSHYFEFVVSSADAKSRKPDEAIFQYALRKLALPAAHVLHVGDSHSADFAGATLAGMQAFHLQRPSATLLDALPLTSQSHLRQESQS